MYIRNAYLNITGVDIPNGLRINFKIEKSLLGYPNLGNIKIYNLSESNRKAIELRGLLIQLHAGYADTGTPLIFEGNIINVVHQKLGPDWISEIFAGDGSSVWGTSTVNKTYPAGSTLGQIYDDLLTKMDGIKKGVTEGLADCLSGKRSILREWQLSGNIKTVLEKLAKECGFEHFIENGVIETVPTGYPVSFEPPLIINQNSGMIGSPERTEQGINVKNLLLPELKLARTIRIESVSTKINFGNLFFRTIPPVRNAGTYRIDKIIHIGDTHDNPWYTQIFGRDLP